jgi:glucose/arabinose dehydrogenase
MPTRMTAVAMGVAMVVAMPMAQARITRAPSPEGSPKIAVETFSTGLSNPWAFQFLPDGRIIANEVRGRMRIVEKDGRVSAPLGGVPPVISSGQGGLLDLALAPDFATSRQIYFTYSEPRGNGRNGTAVARARLVLGGSGSGAGAGRIEDVTVIFRQKPDYASSMHFGSRIAFTRDRTMFVTLGERSSAPDEAQNPANHFGKVIHINQDGSPAADNPRLKGWAPEVWSIGHRNPQSAAIHPTTGKLWTVEHGARGGDEVNIPQAGKNYGWPVISYGRHYSGMRIGVGNKKSGLEQPIYYWDPSIAPCGMAFYTGDLVPEWKGNLFVGALAGSHLARLVLDGEEVVAVERLLGDLGERIRDVRQGPDGAIYVATDNSRGRILRVGPARSPTR